MSNDPLIRALRRFSYCAGVTLLVVPIVSLSLDIMDLRTLPPRLSRSVLGFRHLWPLQTFHPCRWRGSAALPCQLSSRRD